MYMDEDEDHGGKYQFTHIKTIDVIEQLESHKSTLKSNAARRLAAPRMQCYLAGVDDTDKIVHLQRRAADQAAVDIGLAE